MKISHFERDNLGVLGGQLHLVPNPGTVETINFACNAYGFLIARGEKLTACQFAERIAKHYDCEENQQNRAVVQALGVCL